MIFKDETYQLIGAAFEFYNELGSELLEPVYQEAFEHELSLQQVPFIAQPPLKIRYKGIVLEKQYFADLIAFDKIIIELEAIETITSREESQLLNYLQAANLKLGLIINFGSHPKVEHKRIIN